MPPVYSCCLRPTSDIFGRLVDLKPCGWHLSLISMSTLTPFLQNTIIHMSSSLKWSNPKKQNDTKASDCWKLPFYKRILVVQLRWMNLSSLTLRLLFRFAEIRSIKMMPKETNPQSSFKILTFVRNGQSMRYMAITSMWWIKQHIFSEHSPIICSTGGRRVIRR